MNGVCEISLSGEQTVELEIGSFERDLRVGPIEPGAVTLSVRGDEARLGPGGSAQLGGLQIQLKSVTSPERRARGPARLTSRPRLTRKPHQRPGRVDDVDLERSAALVRPR